MVARHLDRYIYLVLSMQTYVITQEWREVTPVISAAADGPSRTLIRMGGWFSNTIVEHRLFTATVGATSDCGLLRSPTRLVLTHPASRAGRRWAAKTVSSSTADWLKRLEAALVWVGCF